ncbi:MAG: CoF synthetase [Cellvibrionaceae bacterium]|nr:CoF synthetase [Cellvibrionaceae bacterium]|tara:strand:- start:76316 stop:77629 length:1314 start_codon:yes stop_codon:yes gene_type:complete
MLDQSNYQYFDPHIETLPREQIAKLQESRVLQLIPYVYQRSPLVRELWSKAGITPDDIQSMDDFKAKVPFMDKDTIRAYRDQHDDPFGGLTCATAPHLKGVGFTSGTTGDPTPVPRSERHISTESTLREAWQIGARPGDTICDMLFTFRDGLSLDRWMEAGFITAPVQHLPSEIPTFIEVSRQLRPTVLFMLSTPMIMALEQYQKETDDDLTEALSSYKGVIFGGEALNPHFRQLVESWGLEIFILSSLGDIATTMECKAHDGLHTWEDLALVEHLDPVTNLPVADGERGELVVTSLSDDVAPLIRYRTDDLISFTTKPCSCGRTHGRLTPLGRIGDEMIVQGKSILPVDILPLVSEFPETSSGLFQLIRPQREVDVLKLRIGFDPGSLTGELNALRARLLDKLSTELQIPLSIDMISNEELIKNSPPNKIPRVTKT